MPEARHEKTCLIPYANNKGTEQPAHPRSLVNTFLVRCLNRIISILAKSKISRLYSWADRFESYLVANPWRQGFSRRCSCLMSIRLHRFLSIALQRSGPTGCTFESSIIGQHYDPFSSETGQNSVSRFSCLAIYQIRKILALLRFYSIIK